MKTNHESSENSLKFHTPFLRAMLSTDTILIMIHPCTMYTQCHF